MMKLQRRKVTWFIGFYDNVGKAFTVLLFNKKENNFYTYSVYIHVLALKIALINLVGKTFTVCRKFAKLLIPCRFYHLRYSYS